MTIQNCPDCGGTHFGSTVCPFTYYPDYPAAERNAAEAHVHAAASRLRNAQKELESAERQHAAALRSLDSLTSDAGEKL